MGISDFETARDGIEGWEKVLAWEPAIVVTDLKMPRLDGLGLLATPWPRKGPISTRRHRCGGADGAGSIEVAVDAMKLGAV